MFLPPKYIYAFLLPPLLEDEVLNVLMGLPSSSFTVTRLEAGLLELRLETELLELCSGGSFSVDVENTLTSLLVLALEIFLVYNRREVFFYY